MQQRALACLVLPTCPSKGRHTGKEAPNPCRSRNSLFPGSTTPDHAHRNGRQRLSRRYWSTGVAACKAASVVKVDCTVEAVASAGCVGVGGQEVVPEVAVSTCQTIDRSRTERDGTSGNRSMPNSPRQSVSKRSSSAGSPKEGTRRRQRTCSCWRRGRWPCHVSYADIPCAARSICK